VKKTKKVDPKKAWDQAWEVSLGVVKPKRILECQKCGRKTVYAMNPGDSAPFCVKCLDALLEAMGLKRMTDKGPAPMPKTEVVASWSPAAAGLYGTKKTKKDRR